MLDDRFIRCVVYRASTSAKSPTRAGEVVAMARPSRQLTIGERRPPVLALLNKRVRASAHAHLIAAAPAGTYAPTFPPTPQQARAPECPCPPHCASARWNIRPHLTSHPSTSDSARLPLNTSLRQLPPVPIGPPSLPRPRPAPERDPSRRCLACGGSSSAEQQRHGLLLLLTNLLKTYSACKQHEIYRSSPLPQEIGMVAP